MALAALGLTEAPVHEPVHDHHSDRLTSITGRYHASCEIRLIGSVFMIDALERGTEPGRSELMRWHADVLSAVSGLVGLLHLS
jgi:hypothetical protein